MVRATQNSGADLTGSPRTPEPTSLVALSSEPSSGCFSGQKRTMAGSEGVDSVLQSVCIDGMILCDVAVAWLFVMLFRC